MRFTKKIGLSLAAVLVAVAIPASLVNAQTADGTQGKATVVNNNFGLTAAAAAPICKRHSAANPYVQDIVLSTATPYTYTGTAWQNVNCTATTFKLKAGERALVVVDISAEADCNGKEGSGQWCEARALLNGNEGVPIASEPSSFAFDSVAGGTNNWQAHSMNRSWEVRCGTTSGCTYKFVMQTKMHDTSVSSLWLDEVAAHLQVVIGGPAPL